MSMGRIDEYSFEVGPIRPPSEGGSHSLLLRPTRNCSWGRCKFCYGLIYDRQRLQIRSLESIRKDVDAARAIADEIRAASWQMGYGGAVNPALGAAIVQSHPRF